MPMNPRLLRPLASRRNAEAQDWINRVYANGGTVSTSTASAVSTFCDAIDAAGIRDRFYRMGMFCGDNLNAALVPLYRGPTFGGTTYGNVTDTNNGPFVGGDYVESAGLQGNQTSKYLNTGLTYDDLPAQAQAHLSVWKGAGSVGATLYMAGNIGPSTRNYWLRQNVSTDYIAGNIASGSIPTSSSADTDSGLLTISRQGSSNAASVIYKDTTAIATRTIGTQEVNGNDILIFTIAQANNTPNALGWPFTISAYSVGDGLTSGDLTSYYNALAAFQASLRRS